MKRLWTQSAEWHNEAAETELLKLNEQLKQAEEKLNRAEENVVETEQTLGFRTQTEINTLKLK